MRIMCREQSVWGAAGPGFILLGLITLLLLPATARGQSGGGPGFPHSSPPGGSSKPAESRTAGSPVAGARPGKPLDDPAKPCARQAPPRDLRPAANNLRNSRLQLASRPAPGGHQSLPIKPATSGWLLSQCPLPPASIFFLQTNFRKYLETWPTPGSTATGDWPEYIPEDEDNLD